MNTMGKKMKRRVPQASALSSAPSILCLPLSCHPVHPDILLKKAPAPAYSPDAIPPTANLVQRSRPFADNTLAGTGVIANGNPVSSGPCPNRRPR